MATVGDVEGRRILFTSLDAVLWPDEGITKGELLTYYLDVADKVIPFLHGRPVSLVRWTDPSTAAESVYQRTAPPGLPPWVATRRVRTDERALGYAEYLVGADRASIAYLVNLGYLSFHPWGSTPGAVDQPDQLLLDIDPTEIAFREVRNAALLVRRLLAGFAIRSWVKTSGGRGLHVMVPLEPGYTFEQVLTAASMITRMARRREPKLFTLDRRRARRRGKILIDALRNRRGATLVCPFAAREYVGASVAMPLDWTELEHGIYPEDFHLRNARDRLRRQGNPLDGFFENRQSLAPLLQRARVRRACSTS